MEKLEKVWLDFFLKEEKQNNWWIRKQELWKRQNGTIVQIQGKGNPYRQFKYDTKEINDYMIYLFFLIKQDKSFHMEEQVLHYRLETKNNKMMKHEEICRKQPTVKTANQVKRHLAVNRVDQKSFVYNRSEAVRYAERWWNSYNPAFEIFEDDCTNYISQCLLAGGAPMRGAPNREVGWWYQNNNWSFSWSVAHSLRWYLSGSTQGLQAREVESPEELLPGDVICYDFEGDGRWDHNTIVVKKDALGMPLVNAHTNNSRNRYWSYEDSAAWTPNIQYKFFRIGE